MTQKIDIDSVALLAKSVRILAAEAVQKANSGHPGMPMGAADYASLLWAYGMRFDPKDSEWPNRDRFILSAGHGSMLLYSLLHLFGYKLSLDEIKSFRQWQSKTPGHPEFGLTDGVETTTGPLGQGAANGVGVALSAKMLAARYGEELFNYKVYGIVSDGDLMEGVSGEAASLAGHLRLNNLIYFYDDNEISIGGSTEVCFTESVKERYLAYGWRVDDVDGHNLLEISKALSAAQEENEKPSLIICKTTIGFGSPGRAGTAKAHGEPLGEEELKKTREKLGWSHPEAFYVPEEIKRFCQERAEIGAQYAREWREKFAKWQTADPEKAKRYEMQIKKEIPTQLRGDLLSLFSDRKKKGTRELSGEALQLLAKHLPGLVGGSADLEPSTKTLIKDSPDIAPKNFIGKNLRFGVREHAMGAIANGLAYQKCWMPYTATFLVFSDYMRPTIRLAALSHLQTLFIFTHDSFWVGEDGPTHEPIEHIAALRIIPNLHVYRPADGIETALCYEAALRRKNGASTLLFTRQAVPALERQASFSPEDIFKGAYIVSGDDVTDKVVVATGSEVWVVAEAAKMLMAKGIKVRVVSAPCLELFAEQDTYYREKLIPPNAKKASVEAGISFGWERVVGSSALKIAIDHYGASAPGEILAEKFGFTPNQVAEKLSNFFRY
jgi:transketolase